MSFVFIDIDGTLVGDDSMVPKLRPHLERRIMEMLRTTLWPEKKWSVPLTHLSRGLPYGEADLFVRN
ncbi:MULTISPECIES: hypothetical protein [Paenibacillus]|uniref:hypothetical protein n=1 Tax=Paenibacillus TaxID=44249 RepID=UPI000A688C57|nr:MULTISPECIES: hypothetical protein [Paenibacillus]